jgi:threonine/homoserine/homoserine lactone efflux protein
MLEIIFKGIIIGLFISVPMGPIGMLCVQRTIHRGRKHGIATGLGATASDLVYTIIALFFIGFVVDFLEAHKFIIQLSGSFVVVGFGIFIFRSNPSTQPKPNQTTTTNIWTDFITSFILTLSNPLILFILLALFARFSFLAENTGIAENTTGLISILAGAYIWWNILTLLVGKFRYMFTISGLKLLNQILGSIIISIGLIGIVINMIERF